jgi:hypothetical protein
MKKENENLQNHLKKISDPMRMCNTFRNRSCTLSAKITLEYQTQIVYRHKRKSLILQWISSKNCIDLSILLMYLYSNSTRRLKRTNLYICSWSMTNSPSNSTHWNKRTLFTPLLSLPLGIYKRTNSSLRAQQIQTSSTAAATITTTIKTPRKIPRFSFLLVQRFSRVSKEAAQYRCSVHQLYKVSTK